MCRERGSGVGTLCVPSGQCLVSLFLFLSCFLTYSISFWLLVAVVSVIIIILLVYQIQYTIWKFLSFPGMTDIVLVLFWSVYLKTWSFWSHLIVGFRYIVRYVNQMIELFSLIFDFVSLVAGQSPGLIFLIFKFCLVKRTIWSFLSFSLLIGQLTVQSFASPGWLVTDWPCMSLLVLDWENILTDPVLLESQLLFWLSVQQIGQYYLRPFPFWSE
jgi:hypothetical protein